MTRNLGPFSRQSHPVTAQIGENCPGSDHLTVTFRFDVLRFT